MASSGSFHTDSYEGRYLSFDWSVKSQSIDANSTPISWSLTGGGTAVSGYYYTQNIKVMINGQTVYYFPLEDGQVILWEGTVVTTGTYTVPHDSNGSGSLEVYVEAGIFSWPVNCSGSASWTLPTIARASSLDLISCATAYFDGKLTYKYTPKTSAYYNRCVISLNKSGALTTVKTINLGKQSAAQQTATVTLASGELATIYNELTTVSAGTLRFTLTTYSDSGYNSNVGNAVYREISLTIPNNNSTQPSVGMTLSAVSGLSSAFTGLYIQGRSKVDANFSSSGKYGASIIDNSMSIQGKSYGSPYTSEYMAQSGDILVTGYATDSRGFRSSAAQYITVIPYTIPAVRVSLCERCNAAGELDETGTYLRIQATRTYSKCLASGVQKNYCQIRFRYRLSTAPESAYSGWITLLAGSNSSDTYDGIVNSVVFSSTSSYIVQVGVVDDVGESSNIAFTIQSEEVYWHRTARGLALGMYKSAGGLEVGWDARFYGDVYIGDSGTTLKDYIKSVINEGG